MLCFGDSNTWGCIPLMDASAHETLGVVLAQQVRELLA